MFQPFDGQQNLDGSEHHILSGRLGAVLVGFGAMQWQVVTKLFAGEPVIALQILLAGMWSWFVVYCVVSVMAGAPFNVVMNVPILLMFVVPLWRDVSSKPVPEYGEYSQI